MSLPTNSATELATKASHYLHHLCQEINQRRVGTPGNQAATDFFAQKMANFGFSVERPPFDCLDWSEQGARLSAAGQDFAVQVSPFSLGCQVRAELVAVASIAELEAVNAEGKLLLLRGVLTKEQLMPKNFPFYNPDEHQEIYRMVEGSYPAAVVCATARNPELAGGLYPFPLFEDGDFDIPSVYMTEEEGERLFQLVGRDTILEIKAERRPSQGCNVVARKGAQGGRRVVLTAHIDAKDGTPGALDNAAGVATLLLLAELLKDYQGKLGIEIVAINGEDHYAAPGEIQYVRMNVATLKDIYLNINLDGVGYREGQTAFSFYQCPPTIEQAARQVFGHIEEFIEGEAWYQGDHMVFVQNDVAALALTSDQMTALWTDIAHTPNDLPELVDGAKLVEIAQALRNLILKLEIGSNDLC